MRLIASRRYAHLEDGQLRSVSRKNSVHALRCTRWRFDSVVRRSYRRLPGFVRHLLTNVVLVVEDAPPTGYIVQGTALGTYQGTPLGERGSGYTMVLPDKITIYRRPLIEACSSVRELKGEIELTMLHELGHYFGLDDHELPF